MLSTAQRQGGFTLIELMIASLVSLITLAVVLTVYSATAGHSSRLLQQAQLHQQLHALIFLISRDLKRAGHWHFDPGSGSPADNPFQNADNRLRVDSHPGERRSSCILFAYDLDRDGLTGIGRCNGARCAKGTDSDNVEQFGFRLRNGAIQSRYGGRTFSCDSGNWQSLSDPDIEISRLEFTDHQSCLNLDHARQPCRPDAHRLIRHAIEIRLHGRLRNRPDTRLDLFNWVMLRNDQLLEDS